MIFSVRLLALASIAVPALASFKNNVVREARTKSAQAFMQSELLSKAVPLKQYEAQLAGRGYTVARTLAEDGDDWANAGDNEMYSFYGYSMKYAKCQPVQYFSEDAIMAGEHSPMITEEIVILRLCPQSSCTTSAQYGCHFNYAEYAVSVSEYVGVMLRYSAYRREYLCEWCNACLANDRRLAEDEDNGDEDNQDGDQDNEADENGEDEGDQDNGEDNGEDQGDQDNGEDNGEDQQDNDEDQQDNGEDQQGNGEDNAGDDAAAEGDDAAAAGDDAGDDAYANACDGFDEYCTEYDDLCVENDDDSYIDFADYLDYLQCSKVQYNGYAYFVRPRCDGSSGTIKMAVYYDDYCSQYAGNDISIKQLGLGFQEGQFADYYSGTCIDCSESENPPYFGAGSIMCNKVHEQSAKCTNELQYDLFDGAADDSTECSFIESLRFGTYDEKGQLSSVSASGSWNSKVTDPQKVLLALAISICMFLVVYACYLHHSMTNLLIKSLSHRELLPPSRQNRRKSPGGGSRSGRSHGKRPVSQVDGEWESAGVAA